MARVKIASLASAGLKERDDLQRWIAQHPEIIGDGLLLVTSEFDRWEIKQQKVADRLDLLFVGNQGSPLVAELKRDKATDTVELQALKYANPILLHQRHQRDPDRLPSAEKPRSEKRLLIASRTRSSSPGMRWA